MLGRRETAAHRQRTAREPLHAESPQQREDAAEIDQGVVAAELVQHDVARRDPVERRFRGSQAIERRERTRADLVREGRVGQDRPELAGGATARAFRGDDVHVGGGDPRTLHPADLDPNVEAERRDGLLEGGDRRAGVEQRRQDHVARQPPDRIEMRDAGHGASTSARRAMRAATEPAPSPSSIPTTASPSAQEHSIALSAVCPPCADP